MFDVTVLPTIAHDLGFTYPPDVLRVCEALADLSGTEKFRARFPHARLIESTADIMAARALGLPNHLKPFLLEEQATHIDYYCFNNHTPGVAVFAVHTIVADWPSVEAFLAWLRLELA